MKHLRNTFRKGWRALTRHQDWNIGIVDAPITAFADPHFDPEIRWLPDPPSGYFAADPFVFEKDGTPYILYERYRFSREHGHLAAFRLTADGGVEDCGRVLSADTHLAYPYVFEWQGTLYCLPESAIGGELALYRVDGIPGTLSRVATLMPDVSAVDPTIFRHDERWWLAFTDVATGSNETLYLHHAETPLGPWTPHAQNPVKRDIGSARPAGTPFTCDGMLYRPAQDCSATYGGRIAMNRVTELTPDRFSEQTTHWIEPAAGGPRPHGLHTISGAGNLTVIDGKREHFVPGGAYGLIRRTVSAPFANTHRKRPEPQTRREPPRPARGGIGV